MTKEERKIGEVFYAWRRGSGLSSKRTCPEGRRERSPLGWVVVALDGERRGEKGHIDSKENGVRKLATGLKTLGHP